MGELNDSLVRKKGFQYAIRTAELVRYLQEQEKQFPLSEKLLCSGFAAGKNCCNMTGEKDLREIPYAAAECIKEVNFIIEMAVHAGYLTEIQSAPIREEGLALLELLQETRRMEE